MKIAIIEDDQQSIIQLSTKLKTLGYQQIVPIHCNQYRDVTEELKDKCVTFAFVDLELGNDIEGGTKVVRDIKRSCHMPTLYYSGLPPTAVLEAMSKKPANTFVRKTWKKEKLSSGICIKKLTGTNQIQEAIEIASANYKEDVSGIVKFIQTQEIWLLACKRQLVYMYVHEIVFIRSYGNYVKLYLQIGNCHVTYHKYTLDSFFQQHLKLHANFQQISRSIILNKEYIKELHSNGKVVLENDLFPNESITFGRVQLKKFKEELS